MPSRTDKTPLVFDQVAQLYDRVRPGYPAALYDAIIAYSALPAAGHILEIGCGTGQATVPLAQRGYSIVAIELGPHLAAIARHNCRDYPHVEIRQGAFEQASLTEQAFDLAISATAFHWIDPIVAHPKIVRALKPQGAVALFWNKHVWSEHTQHYFAAMQEVYLREAPALTRPDWSLPRAEEVVEPAISHLESSGLYGPVTLMRFLWDQVYDAETFVGVLNTFSDNRNLEPDVRTRLLTGLRDMVTTRFDGQITKTYLALLAMARPKESRSHENTRREETFVPCI
jgi:SAM-dependent methyltransferase